MAEPGQKRKLVALLSADVVGYSRLMGDDEAATVEALTKCRRIFADHITRHDGRVVDSPGDNLLAEFASPVEAVDAAIDIQHDLARGNRQLADHRQMHFRIGINLGDVIAKDDGTLYGDGVNIAARLEALAPAGGICVSETVYLQAKGKADTGFVDIGAHMVKNIADPIKAFRVKAVGEVPPVPAARTASGKSTGVIAAVVAVVLIGAGIGFWQTMPPSETEPTVVAASTDRPSIAVLPFTSMSEEADQEHFADGMTDDLITDLSKISGLFVIARNSSFFYKGRAVNVPEVAAELGVRYVLEGSVRRADDMVRINAQLIDASDGGHVWAETFDRPYENVFALQDEVTAKIVEALSVNLTDAEQAQIVRAPTGNLEAYKLYQQGQDIINRYDIEHYDESLTHFDQAINLDPTFAEAYVGRAYIMFERGYLADGQVPGLTALETRKAVKQSALRALALNPESARAHAILAIRQAFERDYDVALSSAETAMTIAPNDPLVGTFYARVLGILGRSAEALAALDAVLKTNPKPAPGESLEMIHLLILRGQYERARSLMEQAKSKLPANLYTAYAFAVVYAQMGDEDAASTALRDILKYWPTANIEHEKVDHSHWKRQEDIDRWMAAQRKAGIPRFPFGFEGGEENRLSVAEITEIWYGRQRRGFAFFNGPPASPTLANGVPFTWVTSDDGDMTYSNAYGNWQGTSRLEADRLYNRYEELAMGREAQVYLYRNPDGTPEGQNDYVMANPWGIHYFTVTPLN